MHPYRTHTCNQLNKSNIGQEVKISGWTHSKRDHGGLLFIDLRDHYGITQCVINAETTQLNLEEIAHIKLESVLTVTGKVVARSEETLNPNLATGEVEIAVETLIVESAAQQIPFQINDEKSAEASEDLRLKYRYLDLRREKMQKNIALRSKVISFMRKQMEDKGFMEIQTPVLTASSPEGARDFLVPSRLHPGKFYALPQAPQQFKQLLMVSGMDKYFQIAPCFRDEDGRADRVLEFYQLDMEMSFATQEDVFETMEPVMYNIFTTFSDRKVSDRPFPRITYRDAMLRYGIDKPDLRNPIEIYDVTDVFAGSDFSIFANNVANGMVVRAIPAPKTAAQPRSFFDKMIDYAISEGAKGLGYIVFAEDGTAKGPVAKFLDEARLNKIKETAGVGAGDAVFFSSAKVGEAAKLAGKVRIKLGTDLNLINTEEFKFCWIVDFPLYEIGEESGKMEFCHNPFSMPQGGMEAFNTSDPLEIVAYQYDIVCNGYEMASGAIRNHKPEIMYKAFELAGHSREFVDDKFGGMLNAFRYGAPPHGGCAPGIDRIIMLLADEPNLRGVIAFPPNGKGQDLMMDAPSIIDTKQLRELNIELSKKAKDLVAKEIAKEEV